MANVGNRLVLVVPFFGALLYAQPGTVAVENQLMRISVFADKGALNEIIHKPSGLNLRSRTTGAFRQIWSMNLSLPDGTSVQIDNSKTGSFRGAVTTTSTGATLDLVWQELRPDGRPPLPNVVVHATITLDASGATWRWEAQNLGALVIQDLFYPIISGIGPLNGKDDIFIAPFQDGRVYRNPFSRAMSFSGQYPSSSMNMQFIALSSSSATFALRTQDSSGYVKAFQFSRTTSPAGDYSMQVQHEFSLLSADRISLPYDVVLSAFTGANGDWTDAVDDYKKWAYNQPWVQQSRSTPDWLLNIGASKLLCGTGCNLSTSPPQTHQQNASLLLQDQDSLGVPLLGMLWGWEKYGAWYYGDYFPPTEGWEAFTAALQSAQQQGNRWHLFISPSYVTTATDRWQMGDLQPLAMLDSRRNPIVANVEPGREWVQMDHSMPAWQNEVTSAATQLAENGVDLIQLDGFPQNAQTGCFNPAHGHPLGKGGNWQSTAWFKLLSDIRTSVQAAKGDTALSGEGGAEVYLPWLDVYHSRNSVFESFNSNEAQAGWDVIPLFVYVYHPFVVFVGQNPFALVQPVNRNYQMVALGRTLVWGQIPNYFYWPSDSGKPPVNQDPYMFIQKIANARTTFAKKYLVSGSMLPAPPIQSPAFSASYLLNQSPGNVTVSKDFPAVQLAAWRAADGDVGIVLANTGTSPAQIQVPINFKRLSLDLIRTYTACLVGAGAESTQLSAASGPEVTYTVQLEPMDLIVLELSARSTCQAQEETAR